MSPFLTAFKNSPQSEIIFYVARKTGQQSLPVDISITLCLFWPTEGAARNRSFIHSCTNYLFALVLEKTPLEASRCQVHPQHQHKRLFKTVVSEFGRIAVEFLRRGTNPKIYEGAARKLSADAETVQHGVEGLMYLLTESSKLMISEVDFQDSVLVLGFTDELNQLLLQLYLEHRKEVRHILSELTPSLPHYHNLEWRLDVQVASRALRQQVKPTVSMKLHLEDRGEKSAKVLQTDPATLIHLIQELEKALAELKTTHCRRILRNIK
ncbi:COMM domain-containing protein 2 isoform X1 [Esox lucius]|uniref:COMM domain containing 2 n=1 Tax=Esox lucius TaxID=8010 RepID=A0A3P8Y298_ESOLU|nr:COMM domain-containing protein 2 isoform X1 [Esox lucius]